MNIAFDYDGVLILNKEIEFPLFNDTLKEWCELRGIDVPKNDKPDALSKMNVDILKKYKKEGYTIFIVTARRNPKKLARWLRSHGITENIIPNENLIMKQKYKVNTLIELQAHKFYDDNLIHIIEVHQNRKKMPKDFKLFLSIPEENTNIEIPPSLNLSHPNMKINIYRLLSYQYQNLSKKVHTSFKKIRKITRRKNIKKKSFTKKKHN
jgi:hypothetical protein